MKPRALWGALIQNKADLGASCVFNLKNEILSADSGIPVGANPGKSDDF